MAAIFMFGLPENGSACSCMGPTARGAFEGADQVIIARLTAFTVDKNGIEEGKTLNGDVAEAHWLRFAGMDVQYTLTVEKTYKGDFTPGAEIIFFKAGNSSSSSCDYSFGDDIGGEHLLYVRGEPEGNPPRYDPSQVVACSRSTRLGTAFNKEIDDILYLDKLSEVQGKNRLSGMLIIDGMIVDTKTKIKEKPDFGGIKIKIQSQFSEEIFETVTHQSGVFELYDIPPGGYTIEIEAPQGWKAEREKHFFKIEALEHIWLYINLVPDNAIRGRLVDLPGRPIKDVCVDAISVETVENENASDYVYLIPGRGCPHTTNENGEFAITGLSGGDYLLTAQASNGVAAPGNPFKTPWYPGVKDSSQAKIFSMTQNSVFNDVIMKTEIGELIRISGTVAFSDGQPPGRMLSLVHFKFSDKQGLVGYGENFRFDVIKGTPGTLSAEIDADEFKNCPEHKQFIEATGDKEHLHSNEVLISGEENMTDIQLVFPIPHCEGATDY